MKFRILRAFRDRRGRTVEFGSIIDVPDAEAAEVAQFGEPYDPPPPPEPEEHVGPVLVTARRAFTRGQWDAAEWTFQPGSVLVLPAAEAKTLERSGHVARITASDFKAMTGWPAPAEKVRGESQ